MNEQVFINRACPTACGGSPEAVAERDELRSRALAAEARIAELEAECERLRGVAGRALAFVVTVRDLHDEAARLSIDLFAAIVSNTPPDPEAAP